MPLAVYRRFLDVQDERPGRLEDALQLAGDGHEPVRVVVGLDTAVAGGPLVGVGRRGDYQVNRVGFDRFQLFPAVAE